MLTASLCSQLTAFRMAQAPHPLCPGCLTLGEEKSIPACLGAQGQHRSTRQKRQNWVELLETGMSLALHYGSCLPQRV